MSFRGAALEEQLLQEAFFLLELGGLEVDNIIKNHHINQHQHEFIVTIYHYIYSHPQIFSLQIYYFDSTLGDEDGTTNTQQINNIDT